MLLNLVLVALSLVVAVIGLFQPQRLARPLLALASVLLLVAFWNWIKSSQLTDSLPFRLSTMFVAIVAMACFVYWAPVWLVLLQQPATESSIATWSVPQLKQSVRELATQLRDFQTRMSNETSQLIADRMNDLAQAKSPAEEVQIRADYDRKDRVARNRFAAEFGPLNSKARTLHEELLFRLRRLKPQLNDNGLSMIESSAIVTLEIGGLAGPQPASDVATYLENLAAQLR